MNVDANLRGLSIDDLRRGRRPLEKWDLALPGQGYGTVLFCDSMTDLYEEVQAPLSSLSYNKATGVLTIGYTAHQQATGWYTTFWDKAYPSLIKSRKYQVTRIDADNLSINIGANLPDVPNGTLSTGTSSMRPENLRGAQTWFTWLQYLSGNRFNVLNNGAQSGDTTAQALDRIVDAVLAYQPEVVFGQLTGINEAGVTDEETIHNNRMKLVDIISERVQKFVLLTTTPVFTGEPRATARIMQRVVRMNNRLKQYVRSKPGVILVDAYRRIVDPTNTTGLALSNVLRSSDNIHYSMRGGKLIADAVWTQISSQFPSDVNTLPCSVIDNFASSAVALTSVTRSNGVITATATAHGYITGEKAKVFSATGASEALNDWVTVTAVNANTVSFPSPGPDGSITGTISLGNNNNLMSNPLLTGAGASVGGGITGVYATGLSAFLTGSPTCAGSLVSRSDGRGQNQRTVVTFNAANDRVSVVTSITDILRHIKAGRRYVLEAEVSLSNVSGTNLSEIRFNLAFILDGVTYQTYALAGYTNGATLNSDTGVLHLKTPPLECPAFTTATQARMDFTLRGSASGGSALTADIGLIAFRELEGA
jgi:lysophospholipase L1-like esterase